MKLLPKFLQRGRPTIFVQIASYRDSECQWTIKDLFAKATYPERIQVGVCWQIDPEKDQACFKEPYPFPEQVRESKVHAAKSRGVCWARYEAQKHYRNEDYVLMIDSHMRFVHNWDELMIQEWRDCGHKKAVLTSYPPGYTPPNKLNPVPKPTVIRLKPTNEQGDIRGDGIVLARFPKAPLHGAFLAAGFLFAPGRLVKEVPYDPYMYFNQEEISLAVRMYTHGWEVYHPVRIMIYHYYHTDTEAATARKPLQWEDNSEWQHWQERARKRLRHLLGNQPSEDPEVIKGLEAKYGLGKARSLAQFEAFTGVDFVRMEVLPRAQNAEFIEGLAPYRYPDGTPPKPAIVVSNEKPAAPAPKEAQLGLGHYLPPFQLPDQLGMMQEIRYYAGKPLLLFFLPIEAENYIDAFAAQWKKQAAEWEQCKGNKLFVVHGSPKAAKAFTDYTGLPVTCLADKEGALFAAFGYGALSKRTGFTLRTDANLKIDRVYEERNAENHLAQVLREMPKKSEPTRGSLIKKPHAPVMLIPEALNAELVTALLAQPGGNAGAPREIEDRALLERLDTHLAQSVFPEIRKVGGLDVTCRERYRLVSYGAGGQSQYAYFRDTALGDKSYRRYSLIIAINEGYEGGMVAFPEYDQVHYQIPPRAALVFPSTLMHGLTPIQQGECVLLGSCLFGAAEEAYLREQMQAQGESYSLDEMALLSQPIAAMEYGTHYYTQSKKPA